MFTRMQGLLGKDSLNEGEGLLITRCRSIHMFFMKFSIDVIFVRKDNIVVGCVKKIPPFRLSPVFWKASFAIELPAGTIDASQTEIGDNLLIQ